MRPLRVSVSVAECHVGQSSVWRIVQPERRLMFRAKWDRLGAAPQIEAGRPIDLRSAHGAAVLTNVAAIRAMPGGPHGRLLPLGPASTHARNLLLMGSVGRLGSAQSASVNATCRCGRGTRDDNTPMTFLIDALRFAREVASGRRRLRIESTIGGYTSGGRPTGVPLIMVSVTNTSPKPTLVQGAALDLKGGGRLPFTESRIDMPPVPRMLGEAEQHVFVMPLDPCLAHLASTTPRTRATHVRVHTSTGDVRSRVSRTLRSAGVA